ncbi:MAG: transketolase C-terminal domain-containing protein, partial [Anaerolineae bacterium]
VYEAVAVTERLVVIDEDYEGLGLSGELAAIVMEAGIHCRYGRVCTQSTIPYARHLEDQTLPNVQRILAGVKKLFG